MLVAKIAFLLLALVYSFTIVGRLIAKNDTIHGPQIVLAAAQIVLAAGGWVGFAWAMGWLDA